MVLYTPLSQSDIFPEDSSSSNRQCITYQGKTLYVEESKDGSYELLQLMSTDPQDFLNTNFSPGMKLK